MSIEARKLELIERIAHLNDEQVLGSLELLLDASEFELLPALSPEDIVQRSKKSLDEFESGKYVDLEDLEKESENW